MKILVGCEESQAVTKAFRAMGFEAFSCDLLPCSGGRPDWHLQMDVFEAIKLYKWDAAIFFPDCTYLTVTANKWLKDQPARESGALVGAARRQARQDAIDFFIRLYNCGIPRIAMENPVGCISSEFMKPSQIITPMQFGHPEPKKNMFVVARASASYTNAHGYRAGIPHNGVRKTNALLVRLCG
jgi:hypothetical protein